MADCYITRRGRFTSGKLPLYTYTGEHQLISSEDGGWVIHLLTSGILTMQRNYTTDLFMIGGGGAGVSAGGTAAGGGGYHMTESGVSLARGTAYPVTIGNGGAMIGQNGGSSSAFGRSVQGGRAATSGSASYAIVNACGHAGSAGNLYKYASPTSESVSMGDGYHDISLVYPYQTTNLAGYSTVLYLGTDGWYYRLVEKYMTLKSIHYHPGTIGAGGTETRIFGSGENVGGTGGKDETPRRGQGGGTVRIAGGDGLVAIRPAA